MARSVHTSRHIQTPFEQAQRARSLGEALQPSEEVDYAYLRETQRTSRYAWQKLIIPTLLIPKLVSSLATNHQLLHHRLRSNHHVHGTSKSYSRDP